MRSPPELVVALVPEPRDTAVPSFPALAEPLRGAVRLPLWPSADRWGRSGARDDPYDDMSVDPDEPLGDPADAPDEPDEEDDPPEELPDEPDDSPPRGAAEPTVSLPPLGREPACPAHAGGRLNAKAAATAPIASV